MTIISGPDHSSVILHSHSESASSNHRYNPLPTSNIALAVVIAACSHYCALGG